ncbi:hypothetical protein [Breoghania sp.]|uniref:hypothetical protein n=1 Tax=Breoghania sp. TaxID=2065378 RepID=UPI002AA684F8|nr:hypothetical protein [Breoghania sp.]
MTRRTTALIALTGLVTAAILLALLWLVLYPSLLPDGMRPFEARFGSLTFDQLRNIMLALGPEGRFNYRFVLVPVDMVLVLAYGAGIGCAIVWLRGEPDRMTIAEMRRRQSAGKRVRSAVGSVFLVAPFLAAAFDFWENVLVFRLLGQGESVSIRLLAELNRTSGYKWGFLALTGVAFVVQLLGYLARRGN